MTEPTIFLEGIDVIIKRDLAKHRANVERCATEEQAYAQSLATLIARKKHYRSQVNNSRYNKESMLTAIYGLRVDIRAIDDKVKLSREAKSHYQVIVDDLVNQLSEYNRIRDMRDAAIS